jgi:glycosyltransferase involved in cell wall biosynthesis
MSENTSPDELTVCMPTWNSEPVLRQTLNHLAESEKNAPVDIRSLVIVDNESEDRTTEIARDATVEFGWEARICSTPCLLPKAREMAIELVDTDWFLFLDDDVLISSQYISRLCEAVSPTVGAVQGRKESLREKNNSMWVHSRSKRGGTHATLVRTTAARDVSFPPDLHILEDEFLRQYIESKGYLWIFNHQAFFDHENQNRHSQAWKHGYLGGKYHLSKFHYHLLDAPFAILRGKSPVNQAKLLFGWLYGYLRYQRIES